MLIIALEMYLDGTIGQEKRTNLTLKQLTLYITEEKVGGCQTEKRGQTNCARHGGLLSGGREYSRGRNHFNDNC